MSEKKNISLILNAEKPEEMTQRFQKLFDRLDQRVKLRPVNLGVGFSRQISSATDEVLFTGGSREKLSSNPELALEVAGFIASVAEPIMGVCFGAQVVARQHGVRLIKLPEKRVGDHQITIVANGDPYLSVLDGERTVFESHTFSMSVDSFDRDKLDILGESDDGVEIFAHKSLPHAGVQFHPELGLGSNNGDVIFDALRRNIIDSTPKK